MPELSVLLPYLHRDNRYYRAVQSVLDQQFRDFELLLIDNTTSLPEPDPELSDPRIRFLGAATRGIAFALNSGLEQARGKFIGRMDADDFAYPDRFQKQIQFLRENPQVGAVACRTRLISETPSAGYDLYVQWQNSLLSPEEHYAERFRESPLAHPTVCFRKSLVDRYGDYQTGALPEDYELWLRWMENGVKIAKLPEVLLDWQDGPDRLSRNHPNYGQAAFSRVKAQYLRNYCQDRKVLLCGSSRPCKRVWKHFEENGLRADAWTDSRPKGRYPFPYLAPEQIPEAGSWIVLSLISQPGTRKQLQTFFESKGYRAGTDYFCCL